MADVMGKALISSFLVPLIVFACLLFSGMAIVLWIGSVGYKKTYYYEATHCGYLAMLNDKGKHGEYLLYRCLRSYEEKDCRFLFNVYLPKGEGTTEVDVLLITPSGLIVFESKNYSGRIYGNESQRNWTQTLPAGNKIKKEHFYNPIMQNRTHIKALRAVIGDEIPVASVVVFSHRCTLADVTVESSDVRVIKRDDALRTVSALLVSPEQAPNTVDVQKEFDLLYPFTKVTEETKKAHIKDVKETQKRFGKI